MRLPGDAWLEWSIAPDPDQKGTLFVQRALFRPRGLLGRAVLVRGLTIPQVHLRATCAPNHRARGKRRAFRLAQTDSRSRWRGCVTMRAQPSVPGQRLARGEPDEDDTSLATSRWNEHDEPKHRWARIRSVLAVKDEVLVELDWEASDCEASSCVPWLVASTNVAAIVTLGRWQRDGVVVNVSVGNDRYLLTAERTSVGLRVTDVDP